MIACLMLYSMHYDIHSGSLKISWNCFCYFNKSNSGESFWKGEREGKNLFEKRFFPSRSTLLYTKKIRWVSSGFFYF